MANGFYLQKDLDDVTKVWNSHKIARSRNMTYPSGRPIIMYNIPAVADKEEQLKHTELLDLEVCEEQCDAQDQYPCEESLFQLCVIEMADNGWNIPSNGVDAVTLYILLRRQIKTFV